MSALKLYQPVVAPGFIYGDQIRQEAVTKVVTSAQVLALNATPVTLVAAPGAGWALLLDTIEIIKPAGTAYGGIGAGEDLSVKYTDASGTELTRIASTGFLDQTTIQVRVGHEYRAASGLAGFTPVANAPMVLHLLVGEIITGTSPLHCKVVYKVIPMTV